MSLGGGVAVLLPMYTVELGYGLSRTVDLAARYETVLGVLHYPQLAVRYSPVSLGRFRLGTRLAASYSFFGIATSNVNFTSTFYLTGEVGLSGPLTPRLDLVLAVASELDIFRHDRLDGSDRRRVRLRYDASTLRFGIKRRFLEDLDLYLLGRLRLPAETLTVDDQLFYVLPSLEAGAAWSW